MSGTVPHRGETQIGRVVQAVRELFEGRSNAVGEITLAANAASTTVTTANGGAALLNCSQDSKPFLIPRTANAAAALATTYIPVADVTQGQFVIRHANDAQIDKTFGFVLLG